MKALQQLLIIILSFFVLQTAQAGGSEGNGGDGYTQEFTDIARKIVIWLRELPTETQMGFDLDKFNEKVEGVELSSVDKVLFLKGIPKDMINYPKENKIVISRPRWSSLLDLQKYRILPHEILGVMGVDDSKYKLSNLIFDRISHHLSGEVILSTPQDVRDMSAWSENSAQTLKNALKYSYQAKTAETEKEILLASLNAVLQTDSSRFHKFSSITLNAAIADIETNIGNVSRQVYLLRAYISFAIEDLTAFDTLQNPNDNRSYIEQMLQRSLSVALLSKTYVEEIQLLSRAAQRGILLIDASDYRRDSNMACLREQLNQLLTLSLINSETSSSRDLVLIIREGLTTSLQKFLNNKCNQ